MEINRLRSIIRESINNNLKEIEDVAENAAMEAKLNAYTEAIDKVNKKIEMAESLEEMQELVDPTKLNELKKHLKTLEKSKEKLEKVKAKKNKGKEVVTDEPVEDAEVEEGAGPGSTNYNMGDDAANINYEEGGDVDFSTDEENALNESFLKMQKLAGVITEAQYNSKKSLIENELDEDLASTFSKTWNNIKHVFKNVALYTFDVRMRVVNNFLHKWEQEGYVTKEEADKILNNPQFKERLKDIATAGDRYGDNAWEQFTRQVSRVITDYLPHKTGRFS